MPLIVDTYNVLHVVGVLPPELAGPTLPQLIDLIVTSRYRTEQTLLVCDGRPPPGREHRAEGGRGLVSVRYAGGGVTADDLIAALIRTSSHPRRITVVSSDNAVLRSARRRRCRCLESPRFLRQLADDRGRPADATGSARIGGRPPGGLSDEDVMRWVRVFGVDAIADAVADADTDAVTDADADADAVTGTDADTDTDTDAPRGSEIPLPPSILAEAEDIWRRGLAGR